MLTRLTDRIEHASETNVFKARKIRFREVDAVHHFEIGRIEDHDFVAELVEILAVFGNLKPAAAPAAIGVLVFLGDVKGLHDLLLFKIDDRVFRFSDFVMVGQLVDLGD